MRTTSSDINQLNSFLRSEMSAVASYGHALDTLDQPSHWLSLSECRNSHVHRVSMLRRHIASLGGTPSDWSDIAPGAGRPTDGGSKIECARAAIIAIDECEHRDRSAYSLGLGALTATTQLFVLRQFVPEQERTRAAIRRLKRQALSRDPARGRVDRGRNIVMGALVAGLFAAVLVSASVGC